MNEKLPVGKITLCLFLIAFLTISALGIISDCASESSYIKGAAKASQAIVEAIK